MHDINLRLTWRENSIGEESSGFVDCNKLTGMVSVVPAVVDNVADFQLGRAELVIIRAW